MDLEELTGDQIRQTIDTQQAYEAWREADAERRRRFVGSMRWVSRDSAEYLLRKVGRRETSLGPRRPEAERSYQAFIAGRQENREKLRALAKRLDDLAPINRAMRLGRLPVIAARILRHCDEKGLLGRQLFVVGTNALFAYEAIAGVHIGSGVLASGDIDLLYDARRRLSLALKEDIREKGLIGLLRQVDRSFNMPRPRTFRASNKNGYMVDLIRPQARDALRENMPAALTDLPEDMEGAAIFGLDWLINAPKVQAVVIDERGYPVRLSAIDPRVFALHKAWVATREDREPIKARRDREQARVAAVIACRYMRLPFQGADIQALPVSLRRLAPSLLEEGNVANGPGREAPDW